MLTIGTGRDDPRAWVKAAYTITDAMQHGQIGPRGKLPARTQLAATLSVSTGTVARGQIPAMSPGPPQAPRCPDLAGRHTG